MKRSRYYFKAVLMCVIAFLSSCQVSPQYTPPTTCAPVEWKRTQKCESSPPKVEHWWEVFNDCQLNYLEWQALTANYDLFAAFERVKQARALAGVSKSELYPHLNLEPFYINQGILYRLYGKQFRNIIREHRRTNQLPFVVNYELDLWGKLQRAYESALWNLGAEEEAFQGFLLILTTDLAASYFHLRSLDTEIVLFEATIQSRAKAYEIIKDRYEEKITDYSDVSRAEFEYKNTVAQCFRAQRLRDLEENKIAVLLGVPPSNFKIPPMQLQNYLPIIPEGLPSSILLRRPDIAEAERRIASKHASMGVAYASFFPSISLTGILGFSSPELRDFMSWKSRLWTMGANALQPIFDAGFLCSNLKFAVSKFREADDAYRQTVLKAFQDVEDALANLDGLKNEYESIEQAVRAAKTTYQIASDRYYTGVTFYLDVVDSERQELDSQRHLIALLGERYAATVQLIKALGGCW
jgi:multidrug efflux system outer membrane protein